MDFATQEILWLVDFEMVSISNQTGPYPAGSVWASPNIESATEMLRLAAKNRDEVVRKGKLARSDALEVSSLERYAQRLDAELRRVGA